MILRFAGVISPSFGLIDLWKEQESVCREAFRKIACSVPFRILVRTRPDPILVIGRHGVSMTSQSEVDLVPRLETIDLAFS